MFVCSVLTALMATTFEFTPRFRELTLAPQATLFKSNASHDYKLVAIDWPLCDKDVTIYNCNHSDPFVNNFNNLTYSLSCLANSTLDEKYQFDEVTVSELTNGTFCHSNNVLYSNSSGELTTCDIKSYPQMKTCVTTTGSHSTTFWTYFALRSVFQWTMNAVYSLLDATSLRLAHDHNSDYSYIMIYCTFVSIFSPTIAGFAIKDPEEGSNESTDYKLAFYISDGFFLTSAVLMLFLNIKLDRTDEKVWKSLKKILSLPSLNFLGLVFVMGFQWGAFDTYYYIYLREELGASSQLLSFVTSTGSLVGFFALFIAKPLIRFVGSINMLGVSIFVECGRMLALTFIKQSPPYFAIGLQVLSCMVFTVPWIAALKYGYSIAPPDLIATMAATISAVMYVVAKGLGSFVGGQIVEHTSIGIAGLFFCTSIGSGILGIFLLFSYHFLIKGKSEKKLLDKKAALLQRLKDKERSENITQDNQTENMESEKSTEYQKTAVGSLRKDDSFLHALELSGLAKEQGIYADEGPFREHTIKEGEISISDSSETISVSSSNRGDESTRF